MNKSIILFGYNTEYDKYNGPESTRKMQELASKGDIPTLAVQVSAKLTSKQFDNVLETNRKLIDKADAIYVKVEEFHDPAVFEAIGYAVHTGKEIILSKDTGARLVWPKSKAVQQTVFDLMRNKDKENK